MNTVEIKRANGSPVTASFFPADPESTESEMRLLRYAIDARLGEIGDLLQNIADSLRELSAQVERPRTFWQKLFGIN